MSSEIKDSSPAGDAQRGAQTGNVSRRASSGRGSRLWIASRVLLSALLAGAAVLLINSLVSRPGIRLRFDTTAKEINSLDPTTERVLKNLPGEVTVDVFFRGVRPPMENLVLQVQNRTQALLERMASISADRLIVRQNDMTDAVAVQQRLLSLKLRGLENCVVVSYGDQVEVVRERGELAQFDMGNPNKDAYRPPSIVAFEAEKHITKALLSVTRGERPQVYFTSGHGEADPFETGDETAGVLESALRADGFIIDTWNPLEQGPLPEDAFIVAVVGPQDRLADDTLAQLDRFVQAGGRLFVAPHPLANEFKRSGLQEWMRTYGIEISEGLVMEPFADPTGTGALITGERSQLFRIHPNHMKRHEIVQPFIDSGRSFPAISTHAVQVKSQPSGGAGLTMPLFSSNARISWLDTVPTNYRHDAEMETIRGYDLAAVSEFTPVGEGELAGPIADQVDQERKRSRLVVFGSAASLYSFLLDSKDGQGTSLDLALNAFNWLADREWRVNVSPRDPDLRLLPADQVSWVTRVALWGLPLLCFVLGLVVAVVRGRGGPSRRPA